MEFKKAIKKIVALGAGASMVGATMLGALAAADLSSYPSPFVKDGNFNALIVVGESAATQDVLGAIDIATSLQYASKTIGTVEGGSTVVVEGDAYRIDKSNDFVEILGEEIDKVLGESNPTLGVSELAGLVGGTFRNTKGTYDYKEFVKAPLNATVVFDIDPDDDTDTPGFYLKLLTSKQAYEYTVEFPVAVEADMGTAYTTTIPQLEDKKVSFLGDEYTITVAKLTASGDITLEMMGGALTDVLEEGTSKTYTVNGKDYEVSLDYVGGTTLKAKFTINGEVTDSLEDGETYKTVDGTELGVRDIMENEAGEAAGGDKVEFFLGAKKLKIHDPVMSTAAHTGNAVEIGGESVDDLYGSVYGSNTTSLLKLNYFKFKWVASDDLWIPINGKLSDKQSADGELPFNFDVEFKGVTAPASEDAVFKPSGDSRYKLEFTNRAGDLIDMDLLDGDYSTNTVLGYGDKNLHLCEYQTSGAPNMGPTYGIPANFTIKKNDYFVVTNGVSTSKYLNTYLIQYKGYTNTSSAEEVVFKNVATGEEIKSTGLTGLGSPETFGNSSYAAHGQLKIGVDQWNFWLKNSYKDTNITVDLDGDGAEVTNGTAASSVKMFTKHGAYLNFGNCSSMGTPVVSGAGNFIFTFTPADDLDGQSGVRDSDATVTLTVDAATNKVDLSVALGGGLSMKGIGDSDDSEGYKVWGTHFYNLDGGSGNPNKLTITYPKDQVEGLVYVTTGATSSSAASSGGVETQIVNKIDVGAAVLDTDPVVAGKEKTKNLIVVGGPAINKAAAVLLGKPFPSYGAASGIPENAGLIKLVENEPYVALVVAGWEAMESQMAARVVADYEKYQADGTLKGTEVEVSGTSLTDISVSVPTVVEEVAPVEEPVAEAE
jgi:hypothetical protein